MKTKKGSAEISPDYMPRPERSGNDGSSLHSSSNVTMQRVAEHAEYLADGNSRQAASVANATGMPDQLKRGLEGLSGFDLSPVRVHYNSPKPAQLGALAYAQGANIHLGRGQEKHLAHEGWHVVQQMQGRVRPTTQYKGVDVNDDGRLEREADVMGARANAGGGDSGGAIDRFNDRPHLKSRTVSMYAPVQRLMGVEVEFSVPVSKAPGGGATADQKIRSFLGAGVFYKTNVAPANNGFRIDTDHDQMGDAVDSVRKVFNPMIAKAGIGAPIPAPVSKFHYVGNMEYVTDNGVPPAYDERDNNQRKAFRKSITDMAADMTAIYGGAKANAAPLPVGAYLVGLPPVADWKNFAIANGLNQVTVLAWRTNLEGYINDNLYVQISAGVVPRRISKYLRRVSGDNQMASLNIAPLPGGNAAWVRLLTRGAADAADQAVRNTVGLTRDVRNSKSLRGLVSLMMAYIFGLYFSFRRAQGGAQPLTKNMVAALPRTPLTNVLLELDVAKRPDRWPAPQRNSLHAQIIAAAHNALNAAPCNRNAVVDDPGANGRVGGVFNWTNWVTSILTNTGDAIFASLGGINQIDPHDHPRSKTITPVVGVGGGIDHPRAAPLPGGGHTAQSGAVVTELRLISARPQPNQLLALVNRAINHVRKAND